MYNLVKPMRKCTVQVRKWGNSIGITLPKDVVLEEKIKVDQELEVLILPKKKILKKTFGSVKRKKGHNTQKVKDSFRKELYDD